MIDFENQVHEVAVLRQWTAEAVNDVKALEAELREKYSGVYAKRDQWQARLTEEETRLRSMIADNYDATGDKRPHPALGVRETTKLTYDDKLALAWAKEHDMALALDKKAFEKIAKASPPNFVTEVVDIVATIATDLSKYV